VNAFLGRRHPMPTPRPTLNTNPAKPEEAALGHDKARMLYENGMIGVAASLAMSIIMVLTVATPAYAEALVMWLTCMVSVLSVRAVDILVWHPARIAPADGGSWDAGREIARFSACCLASGLLWAAFPLVFFPMMSEVHRVAATVVLAAIAGGSPAVLAPCLPLAIAFCGALEVPAWIYFLALPGRENLVFGTLGLASFPGLVVYARSWHASVLRTIRLSTANKRLLAETEQQRRKTEAVNRELTQAQAKLNEVNISLEQRILDRTADLAAEISERERYAEALARLASTDALTELANRTVFMDQLDTMLAEAEAASSSVAVLFIDLDKFKQVNDVRGHETGDHVLRMAARLLRKHGGPSAQVARWGGDEFVLALPHDRASAADAALALARKLRRALAMPIQAGMDMLRIDATIGIALYPQDARTHDELIRAADVAMYDGKKEGGGRVKLFDPALAEEVAERHMLEQALRDAIDNGDLSLVFQPIVSAQTGRCQALEALLRWAHPVLGPISPAVFIPVAEQSGQIGNIGRWVLAEACRAAATWPGDAPPVTVNVSVEQVLSGTLLADVHAALDASGLPVHRLQLEITESLFVTDQERVTAVIAALRSAGVRILMDDFGSGYSSLACLSSLPLDIIKIDKSFAQTANQNGSAFIQAILLIARSLRLRVVAEGIETEAQREALRGMGVEMLQGYLFARPMPETEIAKWLSGEVRPVGASICPDA
jgi:diguanylate cyclase (GGDEF)-like protein